jgi:cell division protein FtsL
VSSPPCVAEEPVSAWCHGEKGGGRLKTLFALIIVFALVYGAVKIVPVYVTEYQLQDNMQEIATFASVNRRSADDIKADLEKKLDALGITVDPNTIQVSAYSGNVKISLEYTIPVDLTVYQLQLHFHPHADNASI